MQSRKIGHRRRFLLTIMGVILTSLLCLLTRPHSPLQEEVVNPAIPVRKAPSHFTLPSLEEIINSVQDLDLQRVITSFKTRNDRISSNFSSDSRIVIAATWRSGSTLLGEIMSSHPGVFYHYEPLMMYGLRQIGPYDVLAEEVVSLLRNLLSCNYEDLEEYLRFAFANLDIFQRNHQLWKMCSEMPRTKCYNGENTKKLCLLFAIHLIKVVRARLSVLEPLLDDPRTKLIWLVRDPRAVASSRKSSVTWCDTTACKDIGLLCSDMTSDFRTFLKLREKYSNQVLLVRYEDLAKSPYEKSKEIMQFVDLDMHSLVQEYLKDHLTSDVDEPWSTRHLPSKRIFRWMKMLPFEDTKTVQYYCSNVMKQLGYRIINSKSELSSKNALSFLNIK